MSKKVFVGMSGGVDSSISAYLLQKAGYDVTGVFIKTWSPDWMPCTWKEERLDALRVAVHLGIPLVTIDGEQEYKEKVADYMVREYRAGRTPNPDFFCNNFIKFGLFYDYALNHGADSVATGHYARVLGGGLASAIDAGKDQSYFVAGIKREQLSRILFPVGNLLKSEIRDIARKAQLPVAEKKDSQGLCFIGPVRMEEFLAHYIQPKEGDILDEEGKVVGKHNGAEFVTLGQRHGVTITDKSMSSKTFYVLEKDINTNTITVSEEPHPNPPRRGGNDSLGFHPLSEKGQGVRLVLSQTNWFIEPEENKEYVCQCRYHQKKLRCTIAGDTVILREAPSNPPTPGQICVIYDSETVVGSGVIE